MSSGLSRRDFLRRSGVLVVGFSFGGRAFQTSGETGEAAIAPPASQLDSWLTIAADGSITVYCGKVELGTGVSTALRQIVAEELDAPFERIAWVQGDSDRTVDQGSTVGSQSVKRGGAQLRQAAAEARAALLELASAKLGVPATSLVVANGVISATGSPSRKATFAELVGGKRFEREVTGKAPTKSPTEYTVVGKAIRRVELPAKMTGRHTYMHDVRVDGMLHARVVRPASIGARLLSVDDSALRDIAGARVVRKGDFLAVTAPREWDAVRAGRAIKPIWSESAPLPAAGALFDTLMNVPATDRVVTDAGDVPGAITRAHKTVTARYRWPFQMHASIGPSCGVADVKANAATIWSSTQGAHTLKGALSRLLGMPSDAVHVIWTEGSGCYGHNGSDDAAADAALISQLVGRPVRVQWMRADEHGWEPKGAAMVMDISAGLDENGHIVGWDYAVWTPTHSSRPNAQSAAGFVAAQLTGATPTARGSLGGERNARHTYAIANTRVVAHLLQSAPLRTSSLRGLGSPQNSFANESFMDELALAAGADPVEFRLRHLTDPRAIAVVRAAARLAAWEPRVSHSRAPNASNAVSSGRGFAFVQYEGSEALVAAAVDVDVDNAQRTVRVRRVCVAHDCGLIVNSDGLRNQIEGNVIQSISRTLKEAVAFDRSRVTSLDWRSYPILTFAEVPDSIEIELIDHPELPSVGAGEASTSPIPGAIANAIYDATGVRLREVPLRLATTG
ncbi:MAG TPA: molybdopterin cofactor-binding domain-containing protein [Gemmatimonadaceae bacterium]|nr:molybdopterin cofactor-binding domain-containing protein [Gemmatimonadaceae bacterium]